MEANLCESLINERVVRMESRVADQAQGRQAPITGPNGTTLRGHHRVSGIDPWCELGLSLCLHLRLDKQGIVPQVGEQGVDDRGFAIPHETLQVRGLRALGFGWLVSLSVSGARLFRELIEERRI